MKEELYEQLEVVSGLPEKDIKIVLGDCNAMIGREEYYLPAIGKYSKHANTNYGKN